MAEIARPWTAEILIDGMTLYAAVAKNPKYGTFAIEERERSRRFKTQLEVEEWIQRLEVPNATPINLNNPTKGAKVSVGLGKKVRT